MEQFSNLGSTTLAAAISSSNVSLTVSSASNFSSSGNFRILIDNELIEVTAVSGTTFTVTRGIEGTTAASHSTGATVTQVLTAGGLNQTFGDRFQVGAIASLPAAGVAGRIYRASDDAYTLFDNGSAWLAYGPTFPLTPPVWTGYSWTNQGSATLTQKTNGSTLFSGGWQNGDNLRMYLKAYPSTPFTYTIGILSTIFAFNTNNRCGLILYDSGSGKSVDLALFAAQTAPQIILGKWNSLSSYNSNYTPWSGFSQLALPMSSAMLFLRFNDDGTYRNWYISLDNLTYWQIYQVSNTDFVTPNHIGVFINPNNVTSGIGTALDMNVLHLAG